MLVLLLTLVLPQLAIAQAAAPAQPGPVEPTAAPASEPASAAQLFPRYPGLEPAVGFWTDVFGRYSDLQSAVHSSSAVDKVYEVLDFRDEALRLSPAALDIQRARSETQAKQRYAELLKQVHALRQTPERLSPEQQRLYAMYPNVGDDRRFLRAADDIRVQRGLRDRTGRALQTAEAYLPQMEQIFAGYGLPTELTRLPLVESSFNVNAYSKVGAAGLWQFMPSSARIYMRMDDTVDDRRDPWASTDGAARHLRDDYARLGQWPLALTAYNHGRGGVARALQAVNGDNLMDLVERHDGPRWGFASRNFYAEFLAARDVEQRRAEFFPELAPEPELQFDTVQLEHYVPWTTLARLAGADAEGFRRLNPAYHDEVRSGQLYVPAGHRIRVPAGQAQAFVQQYVALDASERFDRQRQYWIEYKVRSGDSLGRIAQRHGSSVAALQRANGLKGSSTIRVGQTLRIPPRQTGSADAQLAAAGEPAELVKVAAAADAAAPRLHKVKSGQTLTAIARQYRVSLADLQAVNGLRQADHIKVGQTLKIPTSS